jgi:hypothetical protein
VGCSHVIDSYLTVFSKVHLRVKNVSHWITEFVTFYPEPLLVLGPICTSTATSLNPLKMYSVL